jgi:hypothetical protein
MLVVYTVVYTVAYTVAYNVAYLLHPSAVVATPLLTSACGDTAWGTQGLVPYGGYWPL